MAPGLSLFSINAVLILNAEDGSRLFAKYVLLLLPALGQAG